MKTRFVILLSAVALLAFSLGTGFASGAQAPTPEATTVYSLQAEQVQREVQAELAKAQAEIERAMQEVKSKVNAKVQKQLAAKLAASRTALLADMKLRQAELAALAQEKAARVIAEPRIALEQELSEGGWLGVQIANVDAEKVKQLKLPAERGVLITEVEKESPAAKAGLKANDVVTEFNGQRVESTTQFRRLIRESLAGRSAQLTVWREGRAQNISVTLGSNSDRMRGTFTFAGPRDFNFDGNMFRFDMPNIVVASRTPTLGISAEDISGQLGAYFGAPGGEGILVREVNSGSPAEKAGMKAGDVITKIDGDKVRSLSEMREKLRAKREQKAISVGVIRKGGEVTLNVEMEQPKPPERRRITRRTAL
ncbi:MAG: PDZ domain-containing protein [Acidobacteria bacterium]|nr:PDZ domain-containing protein [Acidobacteriota bacterium]